MFFVVQVVLALTLQATLTYKRIFFYAEVL